MDVLKEIQEALAPLKLSVVSQKTGINHNTLNQLSKGQGNPTLETIKKLNKYLGLKIRL